MSDKDERNRSCPNSDRSEGTGVKWNELKRTRNRINSQRTRERERIQIDSLELDKARLWLSNDALRFQNRCLREAMQQIRELKAGCAATTPTPSDQMPSDEKPAASNLSQPPSSVGTNTGQQTLPVGGSPINSLLATLQQAMSAQGTHNRPQGQAELALGNDDFTSTDSFAERIGINSTGAGGRPLVGSVGFNPVGTNPLLLSPSVLNPLLHLGTTHTQQLANYTSAEANIAAIYGLQGMPQQTQLSNMIARANRQTADIFQRSTVASVLERRNSEDTFNVDGILEELRRKQRTNQP